jgi:hypothetical protein
LDRTSLSMDESTRVPLSVKQRNMSTEEEQCDHALPTTPHPPNFTRWDPQIRLHTVLDERNH